MGVVLSKNFCFDRSAVASEQGSARGSSDELPHADMHGERENRIAMQVFAKRIESLPIEAIEKITQSALQSPQDLADLPLDLRSVMYSDEHHLNRIGVPDDILKPLSQEELEQQRALPPCVDSEGQLTWFGMSIVVKSDYASAEDLDQILHQLEAYSQSSTRSPEVIDLLETIASHPNSGKKAVARLSQHSVEKVRRAALCSSYLDAETLLNHVKDPQNWWLLAYGVEFNTSLSAEVLEIICQTGHIDLQRAVAANIKTGPMTLEYLANRRGDPYKPMHQIMSNPATPKALVRDGIRNADSNSLWLHGRNPNLDHEGVKLILQRISSGDLVKAMEDNPKVYDGFVLHLLESLQLEPGDIPAIEGVDARKTHLLLALSSNTPDHLLMSLAKLDDSYVHSALVKHPKYSTEHLVASPLTSIDDQILLSIAICKHKDLNDFRFVEASVLQTLRSCTQDMLQQINEQQMLDFLRAYAFNPTALDEGLFEVAQRVGDVRVLACIAKNLGASDALLDHLYDQFPNHDSTYRTAYDESYKLAKPPEVLEALAKRVHPTNIKVIKGLAESNNNCLRIECARHQPGLPRDLMLQLARDKDSQVRFAVAQRADISIEALKVLLNDDQQWIVQATQKNKKLQALFRTLHFRGRVGV